MSIRNEFDILRENIIERNATALKKKKYKQIEDSRCLRKYP